MQHLSYESTSFTKTSVPIHSETSVQVLKEVTLSFQGFYSILANTLPTVSIVGKVFARVLNERVKIMTVDKVMDEQGGFRSGRGCSDQIFAVKQIVENFVHLGKAYE